MRVLLRPFMIYSFLNQELQVRVVLTPNGSIIQRRKSESDSWESLDSAARKQPILNSDILYEDLGVEFLTWYRVEPVGLDSIKTLEAWTYEAAPNDDSAYAKVRYWISSDYLSFLRVDAYNKDNKVIKRVEINGVEKVGDVYVVKEMMFSTMIPGRELSKSKSYIYIQKAEVGSGIKK